MSKNKILLFEVFVGRHLLSVKNKHASVKCQQISKGRRREAKLKAKLFRFQVVATVKILYEKKIAKVLFHKSII